MNIVFTDIKDAKFITHAGTFHADEVLGTVILSMMFGTLKLCRTLKVPKNINKDVIVYDIGGGKFDHHQKGGNGIRYNGLPYASAGLIWKAYSQEILKNYSNPVMIHRYVDKVLIQGVDAIDNGVFPEAANYEPMSFSAMISSFNPKWDDPTSSNDAFLRACNFAEVILQNTIRNANSISSAAHIVEKSIEESNHGIMFLKTFVPWQSTLLHSENPKADNIKFVIFPSNRGGYNWQGVSEKVGVRTLRCSVPKEWYGATPEKLKELTKIPTANFCHTAGFIGGAETLKDTINMVVLAMEKNS